MINSTDYKQLPNHLRTLITDQDYSRYTPRNQAVWRTVMKKNMEYLSKVAHPAYVEGLVKTGISLDHIPRVEEMNECLGKFGWAAATVDGFIPPAAFMEFQKYKVLVIAADIRTAEQIEYTPAPDIIHEAAGHAPIIADESYAAYLQYFGEIGSRAFSSASDYRIYEAIRHLSILKADPRVSGKEIEKAGERLATEIENAGQPSEMTLIRNLHWWTVEYGLVGDMSNPLLYGAGLLSSIGESKHALTNKVRKIPYTIDAAGFSFDITAMQPQLFVTPDFDHLNKVLDEFADTMALRKGGVEGLDKAVESGAVATVVYSSGLQVSGVLKSRITRGEEPVYLQFEGPVNLNTNYKEMPGEGVSAHAEGFGAPVGKFATTEIPPEGLSDAELKGMGIETGRDTDIVFQSGVTVTGRLLAIVRDKGMVVLMKFSNCTVKYKGKVLFDPSWGVYDMAVGEAITSVFNGPANADAYGLKMEVPVEKTHRITYDNRMKRLFSLYTQVEDIRNGKQSPEALPQIREIVEKEYPEEWVLREILGNTP